MLTNLIWAYVATNAYLAGRGTEDTDSLWDWRELVVLVIMLCIMLPCSVGVKLYRYYQHRYKRRALRGYKKAKGRLRSLGLIALIALSLSATAQGKFVPLMSSAEATVVQQVVHGQVSYRLKGVNYTCEGVQVTTKELTHDHPRRWVDIYIHTDSGYHRLLNHYVFTKFK